MKKIVVALMMSLVGTAGLAFAGDSENKEAPCGENVKCWREFALLARTQAQNAAGLYWVKVAQRHKDKSVSVEPCKEEDVVCWKQLATTARTADKSMSALNKFDAQ